MMLFARNAAEDSIVLTIFKPTSSLDYVAVIQDFIRLLQEQHSLNCINCWISKGKEHWKKNGAKCTNIYFETMTIYPHPVSLFLREPCTPLKRSHCHNCLVDLEDPINQLGCKQESAVSRGPQGMPPLVKKAPKIASKFGSEAQSTLREAAERRRSANRDQVRNIEQYQRSSAQALKSLKHSTPSLEDKQSEESKGATPRSDGKDGSASTQPSGKRKYRRHPKPDENAPERPPSAYVIFSNSKAPHASAILRR